MQTGRPLVPMGSLARNVPGRGTNFLHRTSRTSTDFSVRLDFSIQLDFLQACKKSDRVGATLGVGLGVTNSKENRLDNQ